MIRRLGSRFDLTRDLTPPREAETTEITDSVLNRILTSRGLRGEQTAVVSLDDVDLRPSSTNERIVEAYLRSNLMGRNQEQPPQVDDRDSFSSIAAVINSENQMDTAVEIDSEVSLSASSSRRRNDSFRVSDVDSGDSRAHRRRRLK
ncbi:hypothetical protein V6Z11_A09G152300 [Gossypium hirsutum]